jgi:uncharacterized protein (DUF1684 family)
VERLTYSDEIRRWRADMEAGLRAEDGWLTLIGLFWLEPGHNRFGAAPGNPIAFTGKAPDVAGSFELVGDTVHLHVANGAPVLVNGRSADTAPLRADADGQPDLVTLGDLTMFVIRRGDRFAIRARDRNHPARAEFAGRHWFPIDESYCVAARFAPHAAPTAFSIQTVLGTVEERESPGRLFFTLGGQERSLDALVEGDKLFIIFRDGTSGETTYPAGRYLKTAMPRDGVVTLDFNRAYSPPCAFTDFATCPLPPPQNRLPLRIEAGELYEHS